MVDYGIKASATSHDVKTASDINTNFSSKFSTLKILEKGDVSLTTDSSGNGTVTVTHNLGYAPAHFVFRKGTAQFTVLDSASYTNAFVPVANLTSLWMGSAFDVYTTTTTLVIKATSQTPSTTYNFRYYLLIDLAEAYTGSTGVTLVDDEGMKVSQNSIDVKTGQEYQMVYSQKYKSLQYYDVNYVTQNLSLPEVNSDMFSTPVNAGTYVDIEHGLGYQPFFLCWAYGALNASQNVLVPFYNNYDNFATGYGGYKTVDAFCDSTRVRIALAEQSTAAQPGTGGADGNGQDLPAITVTIKCIIFTENLTT